MIIRAKPLLGTLVSIQVDAQARNLGATLAVEKAFEVVAHIGSVMSAHDPNSDLGRMSRASPGDLLSLDPHTVTVLRASQYWRHVSAGAFNPVKAAQTLALKGSRPGLVVSSVACTNYEILSSTQLRMHGPVLMDLGGIAKGYAVDQAIEVLARCGISDAVVNAGGDLRVVGHRAIAVEVRHAENCLRDSLFRRFRRIHNAAMATSVAEHADSEFVRTLPLRRQRWGNATVMAKDCMTADVLTKWVLQSSLMCPRLKEVMREHHAKMWRN